MKLIALFVCLSVLAFSQANGPAVQTVTYPYDSPTEYHDSDTNNELYICYAKSRGPWNAGLSVTPASFSWTKALTTLTNIVVLTNVGTATTSTAHGLQPGQNVVVTGATIDTDLNATYKILTTASTTTFTFTTVAVSDATYTDAGLILTTTAPRLTAPIWSIQKKNYDGANHLLGKLWSNGRPAVMNQICANRAVTTGATSIAFY